MVNTLFLPELREMLSVDNSGELQDFCDALHPSRTADFMDGLDAAETWRVLAHASDALRVEIFEYLPLEMKRQIIETQDIDEVARLVGLLTSDERVEALRDIDQARLKGLLDRVPAGVRREVLRLSQYPQGTAGSLMATEFVAVSESQTVRQAIDEIARQADHYETIYYVYIVDDDHHLRGVVTARSLLTGMKTPDRKLGDLMNTALITVNVMDDQVAVVNQVAKLDILAIPVIDQERRLVGIITHDDVIDMVREEAADDAMKSVAVAPLEDTYLKTPVLILSWKRGVWLCILFLCAMLASLALEFYEASLAKWAWLVPFIPLVISSGGNSGSQSATLVITALSRGEVFGKDWRTVVQREVLMGLALGAALALMGFFVAVFFPSVPGSYEALIIPVTLMLVVVCGTVTGSMLPLLFRRLGWDPALMSNPMVAGMSDILGIIIYMTVAALFLAGT